MITTGLPDGVNYAFEYKKEMKAMDMENRQSRVMIVDDTPANLGLLEDILRKQGYDVASCPGGALALQAAARYPPDLIMLDIMMPEIDGFEVCRRLKADVALREIPVIFISALDDTDNKVKAFAQGGLDYVTKPFQSEEVLARVRTHLSMRQQQKQLQQSLDNLRELEKQRDQLVHMIAHDMRSPLTSIMLMAQFLEKTAQDSEKKNLQSVEDILFSSRRLNEMISTMLDISRMESSKMPLKREPCDLRDVLADAVSSLRALFWQAGFHHEPPEKAIVGFCDCKIIQRIVENLLANAAKFAGKEGSIHLELAEIDGEARISVHDTGPGIPQEHHSLIFEKFGQAPAEQKMSKYSTGLGLAFCKMAVEAQGGRIGVESEVGSGSTFWFTVPLAT